MDKQPTSTNVFFDHPAVQILQQSSDVEFWDYARQLAHATSAIAQREEYLVCEFGSGSCLLPLSMLLEVVLPPHRLALLPATPTWMPGVVAWRGDTLAAVNLAAYLSSRNSALLHSIDTFEETEGTLLVAQHADLIVGLLVPAIGPITHVQPDEHTATSTPFGAHQHMDTPNHKGPMYRALDAPVVDVPALLAHIVQQIGMGTNDGRSNLSLPAE